jgi:hypothetical protein
MGVSHGPLRRCDRTRAAARRPHYGSSPCPSPACRSSCRATHTAATPAQSSPDIIAQQCTHTVPRGQWARGAEWRGRKGTVWCAVSPVGHHAEIVVDTRACSTCSTCSTHSKGPSVSTRCSGETVHEGAPSSAQCATPSVGSLGTEWRAQCATPSVDTVRGQSGHWSPCVSCGPAPFAVSDGTYTSHVRPNPLTICVQKGARSIAMFGRIRITMSDGQ